MKITIDRAVVEQALEALEALEAMTRHFGFARLGSSSLADTMTRGDAHVAMNNLRAALAEPVQEPVCRDDGMPTSADERYLRRLLAYRVAMPGAYYDDGEAHGAQHGIQIDFMREPVGHIDAKLRALNIARVELQRPAEPVQQGGPTVAPLEADAYEMGAKGGPAHEGERIAFEAWMRGHCWALSATWDGKGYRSDAEQDGDIDPRAMRTRQLWAAWRDRAALAEPVQEPDA